MKTTITPNGPRNSKAPPVEVEAETGGGGGGGGGNGIDAITNPAALEENDVKPGDPFNNLDSLRLTQDFKAVRSQKLFTRCPIRKPKKHEWFRVHPDFMLETMLFALDDGMAEEFYLPMGPEVMAELEGAALVPATLFVWVNRKGDTFIWPIKLGSGDKGQNAWHASLMEVFMEHAMDAWVRVEAGDGGYNVEVAENDLGEPKWPPHDFGHILRVAFKGKVVDTLDHPLIKLLRGRD